MPNNDLLDILADIARQRQQADSPLDMSVFWHPCGTFGCLAGWAAQDERFKALGLQVLPGAYGGNQQGVLVLWRKRGGVPYAFRNFDALKELLDLDEFQACYLFGNNPDNFGVENIVDWQDCLDRIEEVRRGEV